MKLHSGLYRYNGSTLSAISDFFKTEHADPKKGYAPLTGILTDASEPVKDYSDQIDTLKLKYFRKFVEFTINHQVMLIVVFSPEYNTPFTEDLNPVRKICTNYGVPVIDFFNEPGFQNIKYFNDHCHLNDTGAVLFSKQLSYKIKLSGFNLQEGNILQLL